MLLNLKVHTLIGHKFKEMLDGIKSALEQYSSLGATGLNQIKVTTLQQNLDSLIPGLAALLLTLLSL